MFELVTQKYPSSDLLVVSLRGIEQLSKPYSFDVVVAGRNLETSTLADDLLTERVHFHLAPESDAPRVVHGVIRRVAAQGNWGARDGLHTYRLRICPRMQLLARSQGTRIFQHLGVHDIVSRILDEWHVKHRWTLVRTPAKRDYCVQYLESDLRFVSRILAEEGIFYWFEHPEGDDAEEVVVFGDTAHAIEAIEGNPQLELRDSGGMVELEEDIRRFEVLDRVRPRGTLLKEFDFLRPSHDIRATSGPGSMFAGLVPFIPGMQALGIPALDGLIPEIPGMDGAMGGAPSIPGMGGGVPGMPAVPGVPGIPGVPDMPGLDDLSEALGSLLPRRPYGGGERRIYEHLGEADRLGVDPAMAERHLEAHRANARVAEGESRCRRLRPGRSFSLHGAALQAHDRGYTILRVEHEGHHPEHAPTGPSRDVYRNTFWCIPDDVPPRPRRPKRRLQQVLETATVVGPPGEEIHTDEHGRIKVQFHWDLEGFYTQYSSCWIRVMQPWSGAAWGFQFIPRVGMEVLVTFVGGDVDRPMILGCVPNAEHPVPFRLPREKTKSGIRTNSTKGGHGFNELTFDDKKGREVVVLKAERNLDEVVGKDHSLAVAANQTVKISATQTVIVGGSQLEAVAENRVTSISGDRTMTVAGADSCAVDGSSLRRVGGDASTLVEGTREQQVVGRSVAHVNGARYARVRGNDELFVGEKSNPAGFLVTVWGDHRVVSSQQIVLDGETSIVLRSGDSTITIDPDGVTVAAPKLRFVAGDECAVECGGSRLRLDGNAELIGLETEVHSAGASLELAQSATVKGAQVALRGGGGADAEATQEEPAPGTQRFRLVLRNAESEAFASRPYVLMAGGARFKGTTGGDGSLQQDIPQGATSATVRLWASDREVIDYQVELSSDLPPPDSPRGALIRLRALGYYAGEAVDDLTPEATQAIRYFQADQDLAANGELDDDTIARIREAAES